MKHNGKLMIIIAGFLLLVSAVQLIDDASSDPTRSNLPQFMSTDVDPSTGDSSTNFTFSAWYIDFDNDTALYVNLKIGNMTYNMTTPHPNGDASRGIQYYFNTTLPAGTYYYHYFAANTANETVRDPVQGSHFIKVKGPQNGSARLQGPSFYPNNPIENDTIAFNVTFIDSAGKAPKSVSLNIWDRGVNQTYAMSYTGRNFTRGVNCTVNVTLSKGPHYYGFIAVTSDDRTILLPSEGYYYVIVAPGSGGDTLPTLTNASISPSSPIEDQNITFRITYTDSDNDPPTSIYVVITHDDRKTNVTTQYLNLSTQYSYSYTIGVPFEGNTTLKSDTYSIQFIAQNRNGSATYGTTLTVRNGSTALPYLTSPTYMPAYPMENQTVDFQITYIDPLGIRQPHLVRLNIKTGSTYVQYNMSKVSGDYSNGSAYRTNLSFASGDYNYYYDAIIGNYSIRNPGTGSYQISVGSKPGRDNPPTLTKIDHTAPPKGGGNITFSAVYTDIDDDSPAYIRLNIGPASVNGSVIAPYFTMYNMTWTGTNFARGVQVSVVINLPVGNFQYYFTAASGNNTIIVPKTSVFNVDVTNKTQSPQGSAPMLYYPGLTPGAPKNNQSVTFSINYKDIDGDRPSYVSLFLRSFTGRTFSNNTMKTTGSTIKSGVKYTFSTSLATGSYYYYFGTTAGNDTVYYPSSGRFLSLLVSNNQQSNKTNRTTGSLSIGISGEIEIDLKEIEEGVDIEIESFDDTNLVLVITSDVISDRTIILDIGDQVFDIGDLEDLILILDDMEIDLMDLEDLLSGELEEAGYYIETTEEGMKVHLFIPDASSHRLSASVQEEDAQRDAPLVAVLLTLLVLLAIAVMISVFLLSAARRRRMKEAYYEDFEIGLDQRGIVSGELDDDDPDWDDLLE